MSQLKTLSEPAIDTWIVDLKELRFSWERNGPNVIDIEQFALKAGERVFVSGPSGSGKSTLLGLLGGVIGPQAGRVEVLGTNLSRLSGGRRDVFRADHMGFIFQMFNLVPYLSTIENVLLPCWFSRQRLERARARLGSAESEARRLLRALELDRQDVLSRPVTALSIGQQQRVAVARALIGAPEIVIADEPTSALDEDTRARFLELLFAECLAENTTLLFVSHDRRLGSFFDRQVTLAEISREGEASP